MSAPSPLVITLCRCIGLGQSQRHLGVLKSFPCEPCCCYLHPSHVSRLRLDLGSHCCLCREKVAVFALKTSQSKEMRQGKLRHGERNRQARLAVDVKNRPQVTRAPGRCSSPYTRGVKLVCPTPPARSGRQGSSQAWFGPSSQWQGE